MDMLREWKKIGMLRNIWSGYQEASDHEGDQGRDGSKVLKRALVEEERQRSR